MWKVAFTLGTQAWIRVDLTLKCSMSRLFFNSVNFFLGMDQRTVLESICKGGLDHGTVYFGLVRIRYES